MAILDFIFSLWVQGLASGALFLEEKRESALAVLRQQDAFGCYCLYQPLTSWEMLATFEGKNNGRRIDMSRNNANGKERVTITSFAEKLLADGQAKTKAEAMATARLEVAKRKAAEAAAKVKEIEAAKKLLEREQAKKERFAKTQKERKDRTRRLIQGGGILEKAGLLDWDAATLLGGLLTLKNHDHKQLELFKTTGVNAFKAALPAAGPDQPGLGKILVRFPGGNPGKEVLDAMKMVGKGWRWDGGDAVWTGEAAPEAVRNAVAPVAVEIREA